MSSNEDLNNNRLSKAKQSLSRFLTKVSFLDVFAFVPTPIHSPDKKYSKRSLIGSIILMLLMLLYIATSFIGFIKNNVPKAAQEEKAIDNTVYTMPNIALTYIPDMNEGVSVVDQSYYGISIAQGVSYQGLAQKRSESSLGTNYNCTVDWLIGMNFTSFLCPAQPGVLQGNLLTSPQFSFVKITIYTCLNGTDPNIVCQDTETIQNFLSSGRFFLFIQQDPSFYNTQVNAVKALFYFANFAMSQRYEIYLQDQEITMQPDYFHTFTTKTKQALFYLREKTYVAELNKNAQNEIITIWLRLNEESSIEQQVPETLMNLIGSWGALWGVLVSLCAFYFLRHNRKKFYTRHPNWQNFGKITGDNDPENPGSEKSLELSENMHI